ncbi:FTSH10 [Symbiodinium pilosum]|uniref:FTSH10 protein n=1 Tax=Symbiodinium pilosum TaxID=2952 RepID=A0A812YGJ0_SYMPI|nr:FTSH10 [Symbiodinium pilosum]
MAWRTSGHAHNGGETQKIHRRVTWLNTNVFTDRWIDQEATSALCHLGAMRSMDLLKEMEEKAEQVKSPSNYIKAAAGREGAHGAPSVVYGHQGHGRPDESKIHRRATWLSANVFQDRPIDAEAIDAMKRLDTRRALEMFKELEEKQDQIKNPSRYLISAAMRETGGASTQPALMALPAPVSAPAGRAMHAPYAAANVDESKIHRRATWLNANVFPDRPIDEEAIAAMKGLGGTRAMELFKDVEEKKEQVRNPSGYLKMAAARESPVGPVVLSVPQGADHGKVQRRANWLNANVFPDRQIDSEAIEAMNTLGSTRAMELFKDVEAKGDQVRNPSNYLKSAAAREGAYAAPPAAPVTLPALPRGKVSRPLSGPASPAEQTRIHRKVTWLNANVFPDRRIDDEAIGAMYGLGLARAMELLQEIEEKSADLRNPTGWLKTAAFREGLAPPDSAPATPRWTSGDDGKGGRADYDKLHRRITWLNKNVFVHSPLDAEAIEALASLSLERALDMLKELEGKGSEVKNPGGYIKAAVKREHTGYGGVGFKRYGSSPEGPAAKRR